MRVQVVLDQHDLLGRRVVHVDQVADCVGPAAGARSDIVSTGASAAQSHNQVRPASVAAYAMTSSSVIVAPAAQAAVYSSSRNAARTSAITRSRSARSDRSMAR